MTKKHDLKEYKFAKDVVEHFPSIKETLDNTYKVLYTHRKYTCVSHVLTAIEDSLIMLKRQHDYYSKVYKDKGQE